MRASKLLYCTNQASKMVLKVYYDLMSQPCRALVIFLRQNRIPYEECLVNLRKGEHMTDDFAAVNPFQKVPAIDHDGFKLSETLSIMPYLATQFPIDDHWYPADPKLRARVDEYNHWQHTNLRFFGSMYFQTRVLHGKPVNKEKLEMWKNRLDDTLEQINKVFLKNSPFLNGSQNATISDLMCMCELEQPIAAGYDITVGRPWLKDYMQRVRTLLNPDYDAAHKIAYAVGDRIAKGKL